MGIKGLIQDGSLNDLIKRRLNTMPGADAIAPEIMPVWVVLDDEPDHQFAKGVKLCAVGGEQAGGVTQSYFALSNPQGSGLICTLEGFSGSTNAGDVVFVTMANADPGGTALTEIVRDARWMKPVGALLVGRPRCVAVCGTAGPFAVTSLLAELIATNLDLRFRYDAPIILPPNYTVRVQVETAGVDFSSFEIRWRERPANPSELV